MREDKIIAAYLDDKWRTPYAVHRLMKECGGDHAAHQVAYALERLARAGKIENQQEATMAPRYGERPGAPVLCIDYYRKLRSR